MIFKGKLVLLVAATAATFALAHDGPIHQGSTQNRPLPTEERDFAITGVRTAKKITNGVYVIRHPDAPDQFPQSNTVVVIGSKSVLVVDSCYMPSSAKVDIAQIRKWTNKPVRYLVNTHWHYDHTMGNDAYAAAFPGLTIYAHRETQRMIAGYNPHWFARYPNRGKKIRAMLESGKDEAGAALTEEAIKELKTELAGRDLVEAEFKTLKGLAPNKVFDDKATVDLGGRKVQLLHLGRGNTVGDAVIFLPKEKILVAGDLVDHPVPYLGGGFPAEESVTLQRMAKLDFKLLVPGHGEVLHGKTFVLKIVEFIRLVIDRVDAMVFRLENRSNKLEEVQTAMRNFPDIEKWRQYFAGSDKDNRDFFDSFAFPGLVKAAFADAWRR